MNKIVYKIVIYAQITGHNKFCIIMHKVLQFYI
jgi:proline dehydrogenase